MEKHWLTCGGNAKLIVFALGWAADPAVVEHVKPAGCDILYIYDYRGFGPLSGDERARIETYAERYLFAWSFGVLAAELLFGGIDFTRSVAFNGTPRPVDARFGIDPRRFEMTLRGLLRRGMEEFDRRAYGGEYERLKNVLSPRSLRDNVAELTALKALAETELCPSVNWDKAVVGLDDLIFPPQNMADYWRERAELLPLPHYPFADANIITCEIDNR